MAVVNVKVKYLRPHYENLAEWCDTTENVYVGRKGIVFINGERYPKKDSKWCNPYKIGKYTREEVLELYEEHLRNMIKEPDILEEFLNLKGKNLGCWCVETDKDIQKGVQCHGHIILKVLNDFY